VETQPATGRGDHDGASWFVPMVEDPDRPVWVLGLPQAGAGCATFAELAASLGPRTALFGLNAPGRQARLAEPPVTVLDWLAEAAAAWIASTVDRPYVVFGYCSGALLAFETVRRLADRGLPLPRSLVVCSYPAPQLAEPARTLHTLPTDVFWSELLSYGGFPPEVVSEPEYRALFEPALRADYQALASWHYTESAPLDVPIVAVTGTHDRGLSPELVAAWAARTTKGFRLETVPTGHWVLADGVAELTRVLESECDS
jgi:surfactin synthase thioesterase subunit